MSTIRAGHDDKFFRRFLWVGLALLAYGGWCLYDGLVKYPKELVRAEAYMELVDKYPELEDQKKHWKQLTEEKDWKLEFPRTPKKIKDGIQWQYIQLAICLVGAGVLLGKYFLAKGHWVESDGKEIRSSYSEPFSISNVTQIDKTKWKNKGIAVIHYQSENSNGSFTLDDFKFDRESMGKILASIESNLTDEQIVGGNRESESQ